MNRVEMASGRWSAGGLQIETKKAVLMDEIRVIPLPESEPRVETGPVQFGDDWPGVFIRGDSAFAARMAAVRVVDIVRQQDPLAAVELESLCDLLDPCIIKDGDQHRATESLSGARPVH